MNNKIAIIGSGGLTKAAASIRNFFNVPGTVVSPISPLTNKPTGKDLRSYITPIQLMRYRQDVASWRNAIDIAERAYFPQRVELMRLYYDTILNGHVSACIEKRRNLTRLRDFRIVDKQGNENEEWTKYFRKKWFRDFVQHTTDAVFFGYSLIAIGDIKNSQVTNVTSIKRHNVSPDRMNVATFPNSIVGIPFNDPNYTTPDGAKPYDWHVWVGTSTDIGVSDCGYGLLYKMGLYELLMRNLLGDNADYVSMFGQPIRHMKTNKQQGDPEYAELERMLDQMSSRPWMLSDHDDVLELIGTSQGKGAQNPYENLETRCMKIISKICLGHADALDSTPGKLGAGQGGEISPQQIALNEIQVVDGRMVEETVNAELIPKLQNLGIPIPEGFCFEFSNDNEKMDARQRENEINLTFSEVLLNLKQAGLQVDETEVSERIGMTVTQAPAPMAPPEPFSKAVTNNIRALYRHHHQH
jgi:Protein of unknown function (DUF935)